MTTTYPSSIKDEEFSFDDAALNRQVGFTTAGWGCIGGGDGGCSGPVTFMLQREQPGR